MKAITSSNYVLIVAKLNCMFLGIGALLTVSKPTESAAASKSKQGNIDVGAENTPKSSKYKKKIRKQHKLCCINFFESYA